MGMQLKGIAAAPGIGIGPVWIMGQPDANRESAASPPLPQELLSAEEAEEELQRFGRAAAAAADELERLAERTRQKIGAEEAEIFETHLLLFSDEEFAGGIRRRIREERMPAELAVGETAAEIAALLESLDDEYLRGRSADIRDVAERIRRHLAGQGGTGAAVAAMAGPGGAAGAAMAGPGGTGAAVAAMAGPGGTGAAGAAMAGPGGTGAAVAAMAGPGGTGAAVAAMAGPGDLLCSSGADTAGSGGSSRPPVLLAADLSPSDTALLDRSVVAGFATAAGGRTSHSAIMARSLGIPAVAGLGPEFMTVAASARFAIVDGHAGIVHMDPDEVLIREYEQKQRQEEERSRSYLRLRKEETRSRDGHRVELAANIGNPRDVRAAAEAGAEGIGLFRTEFLYMDRDALPSEDEQFAAYRQAAEAFAAQKQPVVIRTLDIGGDKKLPYLPLPKEENPFLGYRAIRLCLERTDLFRTQLRAILRASAYGNIKIMFPMIAALSEWRQAKALLEQAKQELAAERIPFDAGLETGIMIEIPAAALMADRFAREVDFFSIGTNDLVQYTLAADRMNERLAYLTDPFYPAVLRLIDRVIRAARQEDKWVGMCGEMAGQPAALPLLLGLGLHEFSMSAPAILPARSLIAQLDRRECAALAAEALDLESPDAVRALVLERYPFLAG